MTTIVKGQPTSEEVRTRLKEEGRPVLVAMSLGKDAIATELALQEAGVETRLAYMYLVPGKGENRTLQFVEDTIRYLEDKFSKPIHCYPHPSIYRWLNQSIFQPPERLAILEAAKLPEPSYSDIWGFVKKDLGLQADTWVADGVRACDSIVRRASFTKHGVMKPHSHKVSPIHDWQKHEVMDCINRHGIDLPIDYELFNRSFDGLDYRFLAPLKDRFPEDYQQILTWFPLADLEIFRHDTYTPA